MKRWLALAAALVLLAAPFGRAQVEDQSSGKLRIAWAEFKGLYDAKGVLVVDVRDAESFALGHIPGAISIPLDQVEKQAAKLKNETRPIVTYCA